jgi:hypothetical protein
MNRLVVIIAKGYVTADEIAANTRALVEADVPGYAKIVARRLEFRSDA